MRTIMMQISSKAKYEIISMPIIKKYLCTNIQKITNKNNKIEVIILFCDSLVIKSFQNFFLFY